MGRRPPPRRHAGPHVRRRRWLARHRARAAPLGADGSRLAGRGDLRRRGREALRPGGQGVEIVGEIDSGLPSIGLPTGTVFGDYLDAAAARPGSCSSASPKASARRRRTPPAHHYEIDPNRELLGLGAANLGAGLASGMVVNGSLSKTAVNGSAGAKSQISGLVVAALTVVTLLFLTGLFEYAPRGDARRGRHRGRHRAGRHRRAACELYSLYTERLGRIYGKAARARLHRRGRGDVRRADLRHVARPGDRHHRVAHAAALPGLQAPHRRARSRAGDDAPVRRRRAPPGQRDDSAGIAVLRVESGLFFANAEAVRRAIVEHADQPGHRRR